LESLIKHKNRYFAVNNFVFAFIKIEMGSFPSHPVISGRSYFVHSPRIRDNISFQFLKSKIFLNDQEINIFYNFLNWISKKHGYKILLQDLSNHLNMEYNSCRILFAWPLVHNQQIMEKDTCFLTMIELSISVWFYCTYEEKLLHKFLFSVIDIKKMCGTISCIEIRSLFEAILDSNLENNLEIELINFKDENGDNRFDFADFDAWITRHEVILEAIVRHQNKIRNKVTQNMQIWPKLVEKRDGMRHVVEDTYSLAYLRSLIIDMKIRRKEDLKLLKQQQLATCSCSEENEDEDANTRNFVKLDEFDTT
jgi:hypothetical protein